MIEASRIVTDPLFKLGGQPISLLWLIQLLLLLLAVILVARLLKLFLKQRLLVRIGIDAGNREAIATLISYGFSAISFLVVLQSSGLNLASLAVLAGGLGVGIGFGLQDVTKNLISGITLLMERKLKVGDFVELDGCFGHIREISIRSTVIRTLAGGDIVFPNSQLVENRILNWSYDNFTARIEIPVGVTVGSDPLLVTEILLHSAYTESAVLHEPVPKVIFSGFGESSLDFELWVWVDRIDRHLLIKSSLYFIIESNLRQYGITIPFPQRDVWLRNPQELNFHKSHQKLKSPETAEPARSRSVQSPKPFSLQNLLPQISYFQHFSDLDFRCLLELGRRQHLSPSDILFRQGDPGNAFCIVLSGAIEAFYDNGEIERHLFTFSAGQFFGELPLMLGIPYPTTMRAAEETIVFIINRQGFEKLLRDRPELAEEITLELAKRQEVLQEHQQKLRELGLWEEEDQNPVSWVRKRLKQLFKI